MTAFKVPASAYAALPGMTSGGLVDPACKQEALASAHTSVNNIARHLHNAGLAAEPHVAVGQVETELVRCAEAVDTHLVLVGRACPALAEPGKMVEAWRMVCCGSDTARC